MVEVLAAVHESFVIPPHYCRSADIRCICNPGVQPSLECGDRSPVQFCAIDIRDVLQDPKDDSNIILGVVLFLVIILLATTQYLNERAAGSVAAQLRNLLPSNANVIRDGKESQLNAVDLVVGDIVHMTIGSRVPADIKVLENRDLKLDFSALTGESDPIAMATTAADDKPHESKNIAFMSSQVIFPSI